jgi:hypothetical protein
MALKVRLFYKMDLTISSDLIFLWNSADLLGKSV